MSERNVILYGHYKKAALNFLSKFNASPTLGSTELTKSMNDEGVGQSCRMRLLKMMRNEGTPLGWFPGRNGSGGYYYLATSPKKWKRYEKVLSHSQYSHSLSMIRGLKGQYYRTGSHDTEMWQRISNLMAVLHDCGRTLGYSPERVEKDSEPLRLDNIKKTNGG